MTTKITAKTATPEPWPPEDDAKLVAYSKQRAREYEADALDHELGLDEPESGRETLVAAHKYLRERGVDPARANTDQMAEALVAVTS